MASSGLFVSVLAFVFVAANAAKVPPTWKVCKRSLPLPDYEKCIYGALQGAALELTEKGAPSLGIPPMEPLKITRLEIGEGTGPVAVEIKFEDFKLGNLNTVVVDNIRHKDVEKYRFGADIHLTKPMLVDSKYELQGKVLVLPIKGKGDAHLELENFRANLDLSGTPFKKGGEDYLKIDVFDVKFDTDRLRMKFDNLFDGNKELGDNMNLFLNENWDSILKELKPAIMEGISAAFKSIANQIFTKIPYRQIIPA